MSYRLVLAIALCAVSIAHAADKPNVILIMTDDLGWGDVGFNGNKTIETPHLDRLAGEGLVMRRFYSASAVCSPTRGSCLTGRHPERYGIHHANVGHLPPEEITLAELLRDAGYATGHFGKWHLGTLTKTVKDSNRGGPKGASEYSPPWDNGFDVCFSTEAKTPTWDPMRKPAKGASGKGWAPLGPDDASEHYNTRYWNERGEEITDNLDGDDSRVIMDRAIPFIEKAAADGKPFFTVIWFHTPHLPVVAGPAYHKMYEGHDLYHRSYFGCVTAMDEQVGRLHAALKKAGVAENTMLWFASDNGPEGNAKAPGTVGSYGGAEFKGRKRSLHEGGVRVPALLVWPAKVKPGQTDFPAVTSDYLPTVLDVLDLEMPDDRPIDGVSLLPMITGAQTERPRPIAFEFGGKVSACDNRHKIIGSSKQIDGLALYDIVKDPGELTDLSEKRPLVVDRMRAFLESWRASCKRSRAGADYPDN